LRAKFHCYIPASLRRTGVSMRLTVATFQLANF
jgi:hypothetical protein